MPFWTYSLRGCSREVLLAIDKMSGLGFKITVMEGRKDDDFEVFTHKLLLKQA
jgi:hypothetical protein